jgi:hypothetical protein
MKVQVHLYSQSVPVRIENVRSTYTKDGLYCVLLVDNVTVYKFPYEHIFRIKEEDTEQLGTETKTQAAKA